MQRIVARALVAVAAGIMVASCSAEADGNAQDDALVNTDDNGEVADTPLRPETKAAVLQVFKQMAAATKACDASFDKFKAAAEGGARAQIAKIAGTLEQRCWMNDAYDALVPPKALSKAQSDQLTLMLDQCGNIIADRVGIARAVMRSKGSLDVDHEGKAYFEAISNDGQFCREEMHKALDMMDITHAEVADAIKP